ncbi:hypothetical protein KKH23_11120 [Patescibacteria group bacterium]|nr:hypothetical protein [Patescibacteria group bacterium]MBU0847728.1 hypothetical protein [Patescibacteria group bacterium]
MGCWTSYLSGGDYQMYSVHYTIVGAPSPELPIPDYVPNDINGYSSTSYGFPSQEAVLTPYAIDLWGDFCTPPAPTPFDKISTTAKAMDMVRPYGSIPVQLFQGQAIATRFIPTSVCLPYIILHNIINNAPSTLQGKKLVIEIREEDPVTNLPKGIPGDNDIIARVSMVMKPPQHFESGGRTYSRTSYNAAIPVNAILNSSDTPHWIVLYSEDLVCSQAFTGSGYERVKLYNASTGGNDYAVFSMSGGQCRWNADASVKGFAHVTYKTDLCKGVIFIEDFGFAVTNVFVEDTCFKKLTDVKDKNVIIGVKCQAPRTERKVMFDIAYRRPNGTYFAGPKEVLNIAFGSNTIFLDTEELYVLGSELEYKELSVRAEVILV